MNVQKSIRRGQQKKKPLSVFLKKFIKKNALVTNKIRKKANEEVWTEINCLDCANCCKTMTPTFKKSEVNKIAEHFGLTYKQYFDKYLMIDDDNGDIVNKSTPCQHLRKDNKCAIYAIRPGDCSGFPHHLNKDFAYQVSQNTYQNNIPRCPATLLFVEKLQALSSQS